MRLAHLAILGTILCLPLSVQAADSAPKGVNFGSIDCRAVPCYPSASEMPSVFANASSCVASAFGMGNPFFDTNAPLDGGKCIQMKPRPARSSPSASLSMSAHCCIVSYNNSCRMHCDQIGSR